MALSILAAGCDDDPTPVPVNLVVVGDSLSAGHMDGCTIETMQTHGYAKVLANQAGWTMNLPLIGAPGIRPCMDIGTTDNPLTIARVVPGGGDPDDPANWGVRTNPTVQPTNLGMPGTRIVDVFAAPATSAFHSGFGLDYAELWKRFLDTPDHTPDTSMLHQAVDRVLASNGDRDIVILWLGSNDAMWSALGGTDAFVTPQADFEFFYRNALATLDVTGAEVVVANLPDLTAGPQFLPADTAVGYFGLTLATPDPFCATGQTIGQNLGVTSADYIPMVDLPAVGEIIGCTRGIPLTDQEFLTAAEVTSIQGKLDAFNAFISTEATAYGAVHVDVAALLDDAKLNGRVVGAETLTTDLCGGLFSLDGLHPSYVGYAAVANEFITAMNVGLGLSIPAVNEAAVRGMEPPKHNCVAGG